MNRLVLGILGVVAALVIAIAAISIVIIVNGGESSNGGSQSERAASPAATQEEGGGPAAGELRLAGSDPITLDPARAQDAASANYIVEIFGGLVTLDQQLRIQPDLAERWDVSPDGKTYTFHLRPDAVFSQDGRPVTAEDVRYSLERAADPKTESLVAEAYLSDIVGARDKIRGRADHISGIEVIDDHTLKITIDAPKPYFLDKLTYPTAFVVDKNQIESNPRNWTRKPNGTGPFKLKEWKINERIVLEANNRYHLGVPKVKTVRFELAGGSSLSLYEDGQLDVSGIGLDDIERVLDTSDPLHKEYKAADNLAIDYIGFNTKVPPFDDPKVRQAFAEAIDREKIAKVVLKDVIPVANGILQPGLPGYDPNSKTLPYDPEHARQLLSESRYADNMPEVTLAISGGGATVGPTDEAIVQMWKENLGIDVKIQQAESATFFSDLDQGNLQLFHLGWVMDYPDPENILDLLFHSKSQQNAAQYGRGPEGSAPNSKQVDSLLEQARTEQDQAKRFDLYRQAQRLIIQDAPWIPMFFERTHVVVKPYVKDYNIAPIMIPRLRFVSIER